MFLKDLAPFPVPSRVPLRVTGRRGAPRAGGQAGEGRGSRAARPAAPRRPALRSAPRGSGSPRRNRYRGRAGGTAPRPAPRREVPLAGCGGREPGGSAAGPGPARREGWGAVSAREEALFCIARGAGGRRGPKAGLGCGIPPPPRVPGREGREGESFRALPGPPTRDNPDCTCGEAGWRGEQGCKAVATPWELRGCSSQRRVNGEMGVRAVCADVKAWGRGGPAPGSARVRGRPCRGSAGAGAARSAPVPGRKGGKPQPSHEIQVPWAVLCQRGGCQTVKL